MKNCLLIKTLKHNLPFANDDYLNSCIYNRFRNYELVYLNDADNLSLLTDNILRYRDKFIQLAKLQGWSSTYKILNGEYTYNPIENYNRIENSDTDTTNNIVGDTNRVGNTKISDSGYSTNNFTDTEKTETSSKDEYKSGSTGKSIVNSSIKGNIGVITTSEMIEKERELIMNLISDYVDTFSNCFNLTM